MDIERRLRKLESLGPNEYYDPIVSLIVEKGESKEEVIRRHFGEEGPPENALIILHIIVSPPIAPYIQ